MTSSSFDAIHKREGGSVGDAIRNWWDDSEPFDDSKKPKKHSFVRSLEVLESLMGSQKGINTVAKLGRNMESLADALGISTPVPAPEAAEGFKTGAQAAYNTFTTVNGVLAGVNFFVTFREKMRHIKAIKDVFDEIIRGDWSGLTLPFILDELAFWGKEVANRLNLSAF